MAEMMPVKPDPYRWARQIYQHITYANSLWTYEHWDTRILRMLQVVSLLNSRGIYLSSIWWTKDGLKEQKELVENALYNLPTQKLIQDTRKELQAALKMIDAKLADVAGTLPEGAE